MNKIQSTKKLFKKPGFILILISVIFLLKGILLSSAFPIFGGQDEARHYNTIQWLSEPSNVDRGPQRAILEDKYSFADYNFSEEIKNTGTAAEIDSLRSDIFNTVEFSNSNTGKNEDEINAKKWTPYNLNMPADIAYGGTQLYHKIGSIIEKLFTNQSILVRFYLIRIFSVLLGMVVVLLTYLIAKTIGFSTKHALILAAIVSFQPKFSMYFAGINYDVLLIPMFVLFTWAGLLILKHGLNWKNGLLAVLSITIAILTKSTGYILVVPFAFLLAYLLFEKVRTKNKRIQLITYGGLMIAFIVLALLLKSHLPSQSHSISQTMTSVSKYLSKSISIGRFGLSSRTYWGTLGWTNNWLLDNVTNFIWLIQAFAIWGLGIFFFSKNTKQKFLPEKKYVAFLIGMIVILQLGIRTADWAIFSQTGSLDLGTPGRYFLPNLATHIILVFTGLGALFSYFLQNTRLGKALDSRLRGNDNAEKWFDYSLITGLILMMSFMMYLVFDVIIYRFYM